MNKRLLACIAALVVTFTPFTARAEGLLPTKDCGSRCTRARQGIASTPATHFRSRERLKQTPPSLRSQRPGTRSSNARHSSVVHTQHTTSWQACCCTKPRLIPAAHLHRSDREQPVRHRVYDKKHRPMTNNSASKTGCAIFFCQFSLPRRIRISIATSMASPRIPALRTSSVASFSSSSTCVQSCGSRHASSADTYRLINVCSCGVITSVCSSLSPSLYGRDTTAD